MKNLGHIAFICSGNICRSPMAAALTREMLDKMVVEARVSSAGTLGIEGHRADAKAVKALSMLGIDLTDHRSQGVSGEYLRDADAIVVKQEEHATAVQLLDASCGPRIYRLWQYTSEPQRLNEIFDPIGRDLEDFLACRDDLIECLQNWLTDFVERRL